MARHLLTVVHRPDMVAKPLPLAPAFIRPRRALPLGDLVERCAQPIARFLDRTIGTRLAGCSACSRRRQYLNHLVPDIRSLGAWLTALSRLRGPSPQLPVPSAQPPAPSTQPLARLTSLPQRWPPA